MKFFMSIAIVAALVLTAPSHAVDQIAIGGSGFDLGSSAGASPFANLSILSLDTATVTLDIAPGESLIPLSMQVINGSGEGWLGLLLEADGGTFAGPPAPLVGGSPSVLSNGDTVAILTTDLNAGGFTFLSANLTPSSDPFVLSLTPITTIPTPASAVIMLAGVAGLLCRRTGRG